jgi:hypothetical protein
MDRKQPKLHKQSERNCGNCENNWTLMPACRVNRFFLSAESEINIGQTDFWCLF